jgi:hypothetical protein
MPAADFAGRLRRGGNGWRRRWRGWFSEELRHLILWLRWVKIGYEEHPGGQYYNDRYGRGSQTDDENDSISLFGFTIGAHRFPSMILEHVS